MTQTLSPLQTATGRGPWLAVAGLIALQAGVLVWMVWHYEAFLSEGREIRLDVAPVDPRSLFRGDYVILNYKGLSRLEPPVFSGMPIGTTNNSSGDGLTFSPDSPVAVIIAPNETGQAWQAVRIQKVCPTPEIGKEACLMATVVSLNTHGPRPYIRLKYGLENYFVSQGRGRRLENVRDIKRLQVIVALKPQGQAIIKGLVLDGERISHEGLF